MVAREASQGWGGFFLTMNSTDGARPRSAGDAARHRRMTECDPNRRRVAFVGPTVAPGCKQRPGL
jgi:hypothetical protein